MSNSGWKELDTSLRSEKASFMEHFLKSQYVGQERAVNCLVDAYDLATSPLKQNDQPVVCALFLGPSGVGKTCLAELLIQFLLTSYGRMIDFSESDEEHSTKIECGSYVERHQLSRLIGAPAGYIGYNDTPLLDQHNIDRHAFAAAESALSASQPSIGAMKRRIEELENNKFTSVGDAAAAIKSVNEADNIIRLLKKEQAELIEKISGHIWSVILFDEIEKAHEAVRDFLLEVTSKGRASLQNGNVTSFKDSFVIMTSNVGSEAIADLVKGGGTIGFSHSEVEKTRQRVYETAMKELKKSFRNEFLGRIEENIVVLHYLSSEEIEAILDIQLKNMHKRLAKEFPVEIMIDQTIRDYLLKEALDKREYGARLIRSKLTRYVRKPLAQLVTSHQIEPGDQIRVISKIKDGEVEIIFLRNEDRLIFKSEFEEIMGEMGDIDFFGEGDKDK